jgi:hypothetical protein
MSIAPVPIPFLTPVNKRDGSARVSDVENITKPNQEYAYMTNSAILSILVNPPVFGEDADRSIWRMNMYMWICRQLSLKVPGYVDPVRAYRWTVGLMNDRHRMGIVKYLERQGDDAVAHVVIGSLSVDERLRIGECSPIQRHKDIVAQFTAQAFHDTKVSSMSINAYVNFVANRQQMLFPTYLDSKIISHFDRSTCGAFMRIEDRCPPALTKAVHVRLVKLIAGL